MTDMDDIVLPDIVYDGIDLEILSPDMIEHEQTCDQLMFSNTIQRQGRMFMSTCGSTW